MELFLIITLWIMAALCALAAIIAIVAGVTRVFTPGKMMWITATQAFYAIVLALAALHIAGGNG